MLSGAWLWVGGCREREMWNFSHQDGSSVQSKWCQTCRQGGDTAVAMGRAVLFPRFCGSRGLGRAWSMRAPSKSGRDTELSNAVSS